MTISILLKYLFYEGLLKDDYTNENTLHQIPNYATIHFIRNGMRMCDGVAKFVQDFFKLIINTQSQQEQWHPWNILYWNYQLNQKPLLSVERIGHWQVMENY